MVRDDTYAILDESTDWIKKIDVMQKTEINLVPKFLEALTENFLELGGFGTKVIMTGIIRKKEH